jgi:hypothetical protein|tara:strand:+ start:234 stop:590 length:357 start_codon:yes stop_codon:yes gene_type:complete
MGLDRIKRFSNDCLENVTYPDKPTSWHIQGILKNRSNQEFKFDVGLMFNMPNNELGKKGNTTSKADKMVFEDLNQWIIIDLKELYKYLKDKKLQKVYLQDLISELEWNIVLPKLSFTM